MAFSNSKIFRAYLADGLANTALMPLATHTVKVALFGNGGTPDQNATSANTAYNVAQWVTANEISQAIQWPAGGISLSTPSINSATAGVVFFTAATTVSGSNATLANVFGDLVYDSTITTPVANQGICFHYFGGSSSVANGVLTIAWAASPNGIFNFTL